MHVVVWESDGMQYAITCNLVGEVVPLVEMEPLEGLPDWVRGVAKIHGEAMPVVDASVLLGHSRVESTLGARLLVIDDDECDGRLFALMVSAIVDVKIMGDESGDIELFDKMPTPDLIEPIFVRLESA